MIRPKAVCGALSDDDVGRLQRISHHRRMSSGAVLYPGDREPDWFAIVMSGVVKLVKTQADGRQQIVGLQFPGAFIGQPGGNGTSLIVEAATDLELCCFSRAPFESMVRDHRELERSLLRRTYDELDAARQWMFVLGRKTAEEKVASLIVLMAENAASLECSSEGMHAPQPQRAIKFELPLSRTEMAEYLGLTIETVSRQMKAYKSAGLIATERTRVIHVLDMAGLRRVAEMGTD